MRKVLLIVASLYEEVVAPGVELAKKILKYNQINFQEVTVLETADIPAAANILLDSVEYDGVICICCAISEEDTTYAWTKDIFILGMNNIAMQYTIPLSYAIITAATSKLAKSRSETQARRAVESCIQLMRLKAKVKGEMIEDDSSLDNLQEDEDGFEDYDSADIGNFGGLQN